MHRVRYNIKTLINKLRVMFNKTKGKNVIHKHWRN